jgi:hypothetical protein
MTLIEIRPHRWGWRVFEAPGVEPVFPEKRQAISYAEGRSAETLSKKLTSQRALVDKLLSPFLCVGALRPPQLRRDNPRIQILCAVKKLFC